MPIFPTMAQESSMKTRIANIIKEYSAQGIHRTGTEVDVTSATWLARRIEMLGLTPELSEFDFKRVAVLDARLVVAGLEIPGEPLYDCGYTNSVGISGTIGEVGSDADIGIVMALPYQQTPVGKQIYEARKNSQHKAIVIVTDDRYPSGGVAVLNAEDFRAPFGPPVLQVASAHWSDIQAAISSRAKGRTVVHCEYVEAKAVNVQTMVPGANSKLAPLVIMTPRSGWWQCASERGGGIACLLEVMREVSQSQPQRNVIFTANTGHELGHTGLDHYLAANQKLIKEAQMWIHLGANFSAKYSANVRLQYSDTAAQQLLSPILRENGAEAASTSVIGERPLGEARNIYEGDGRYISILGSNGLFHHPADIWPDAVDLEATERWIKVFSQLAVNLAKE